MCRAKCYGSTVIQNSQISEFPLRDFEKWNVARYKIIWVMRLSTGYSLLGTIFHPASTRLHQVMLGEILYSKCEHPVDSLITQIPSITEVPRCLTCTKGCQNGFPSFAKNLHWIFLTWNRLHGIFLSHARHFTVLLVYTLDIWLNLPKGLCWKFTLDLSSVTSVFVQPSSAAYLY